MLPYFPKDMQQVERKRHLGNDVVMIIFKENPDDIFQPQIMASQFNRNFQVEFKLNVSDVFVVVQPEKNADNETVFRISFVNKFGVRPYGPSLSNPPLFNSHNIRDFLLTKRKLYS